MIFSRRLRPTGGKPFPPEAVAKCALDGLRQVARARERGGGGRAIRRREICCVLVGACVCVRDAVEPILFYIPARVCAFPNILTHRRVPALFFICLPPCMRPRARPHAQRTHYTLPHPPTLPPSLFLCLPHTRPSPSLHPPSLNNPLATITMHVRRRACTTFLRPTSCRTASWILWPVR